MKRIQQRALILVVIGTVVMSSSFMLQRFAPLSDTMDGLIKGIAIGFMLLGLIITVKQQPKEIESE